MKIKKTPEKKKEGIASVNKVKLTPEEIKERDTQRKRNKTRDIGSMIPVTYKGDSYLVKISARIVQLYDPREDKFVKGVTCKMIEEEIGYSLPPNPPTSDKQQIPGQ